jgi:disulfide bond formation protein DsbB
MGWTFAASAVATAVNPYGLQLQTHIYRYLSDRYLMDRIVEFHSPDFHGWAQRCFVLILVLVLIAAAGGREKIRISQWLIVLLAAYSGVYAVRNLPVSAMLLVLIAGPRLWDWMASLPERPGAWQPLRSCAARIAAFSARARTQESQLQGHLWPALAVMAALAICMAGGRMGSRQVVAAQFDAQHLPSGAVDFLSREHSLEPVFGPDQWGGYFIYRLYPRRQVVIDDRHDLYGSDRFREYLMMMQGEPGWKDLVEKWRIHTLVLPAGSTLANLLAKIPQEWRTVYEDKVAVVVERKR